MSKLTLGSSPLTVRILADLDRVSHAAASAIQRLSSGMRINDASDDPAGLSVATKLRASSREFTKGLDNLNQGISALTVAGSALGELSGINQRMQELAEQSANGTFGAAQRSALDAEFQALAAESSRILSTTQFNGLNLIDGSTSRLDIQAGNSTIALTLTDLSGIAVGSSSSGSSSAPTYIGNGTFAASSSFSGGGDATVVRDVNGDGLADAIGMHNGKAYVSIGNGDGTFLAAVSYAGNGSTVRDVTIGDVNGDGKYDIIATDSNYAVEVFINQGTGTFATAKTYGVTDIPYAIQSADLNGDGRADIIASINASKISVLIANSDGTFKAEKLYNCGSSPQGLVIGDFDRDGKLDVVTANYNDGAIAFLKGNGDGTFKAPISYHSAGSHQQHMISGDFNGDGFLDVATSQGNVNGSFTVTLGNGDGTFKAGISYTIPTLPGSIGELATGDFNGDGILDMIGEPGSDLYVFFGNSNGSFKAPVTLSTFGLGDNRMRLGDLNGDGVTDILWGSGTKEGVILTNSTQAGGSSSSSSSSSTPLDVLTRSDALTALDSLQSNMQTISSAQGILGAHQSRLEIATQNLAVSRDTYEAAYSRVMDADAAEESAALIRSQILQQVEASLLSQSNLESGIAIKLLGG